MNRTETARTPDAESSPAAPNRQTAAHELLQEKRFWHRRSAGDWLFAAVAAALSAAAQWRLGQHMDIYEICILWVCTAAAVGLGWLFGAIRWYLPSSLLLAYAAVALYGGHIDRAEQLFLLKYFLSSQSAVGWLCALVGMSWLCYVLGLFDRNGDRPSNTLLDMGRHLSWAAAVAGLTGMLVRWHESYLLRPGNGHIPVSNLYEVFILFIVITALMFLYYEGRFRLQRLGAFVTTLQLILVAFVLWYSFDRQAHQIQPLIPALQSWWMKIHVPANFIGYGAFSIAAFLGAAQLIKLGRPAVRLPESHLIEEVMYKAIAVGFLFFTIATILGALWAADAWGRYWSWDPKETWAAIVWLNYAVWLHLRLIAGWRGRILAWWAIVGFFITAFAFVGVNMFLTGLHSYGEL